LWPAPADFFLGILFYSEDVDDMFLRNIGISLNYTTFQHNAVFYITYINQFYLYLWALQSMVNLGLDLQLLKHTECRQGSLDRDQPAARPLLTQDNTNTESTQTDREVTVSAGNWRR
jgi:hypothetical protein